MHGPGSSLTLIEPNDGARFQINCLAGGEVNPGPATEHHEDLIVLDVLGGSRVDFPDAKFGSGQRPQLSQCGAGTGRIVRVAGFGLLIRQRQDGSVQGQEAGIHASNLAGTLRAVLGRRTAKPKIPADPPKDAGTGKNRPTVRRKQAQAARRQPLVPDTRRAAGGSSKAARAAARAERSEQRRLALAGDERYLASRDRGPARRAARTAVDRRWNVGEVLLPVMLAVLLISLLASSLQEKFPAVYTGVLMATYGIFVFAGLDALLLARRVKKSLAIAFPQDPGLRGVGRYAAMRAFQMRRSRIPRPEINRDSWRTKAP